LPKQANQAAGSGNTPLNAANFNDVRSSVIWDRFLRLSSSRFGWLRAICADAAIPCAWEQTV